MRCPPCAIKPPERTTVGGPGDESASRDRSLASGKDPPKAGEPDDPVVIGGGTPFFPPVTEEVPLDLIDTRTFGSRVIFERYRRGRDEAD